MGGRQSGEYEMPCHPYASITSTHCPRRW